MISIINSSCHSCFFLWRYFAGRLMSFLCPMCAHLRDNWFSSAVTLFLLSLLPFQSYCQGLYCKLLPIGSFPPILHRSGVQVIEPGFFLNGHWSLACPGFISWEFKKWFVVRHRPTCSRIPYSLQNWGVTDVFCVRLLTMVVVVVVFNYTRVMDSFPTPLLTLLLAKRVRRAHHLVNKYWYYYYYYYYY